MFENNIGADLNFEDLPTERRERIDEHRVRVYKVSDLELMIALARNSYWSSRILYLYSQSMIFGASFRMNFHTLTPYFSLCGSYAIDEKMKVRAKLESTKQAHVLVEYEQDQITGKAHAEYDIASNKVSAGV